MTVWDEVGMQAKYKKWLQKHAKHFLCTRHNVTCYLHALIFGSWSYQCNTEVRVNLLWQKSNKVWAAEIYFILQSKCKEMTMLPCYQRPRFSLSHCCYPQHATFVSGSKMAAPAPAIIIFFHPEVRVKKKKEGVCISF